MTRIEVAGSPVSHQVGTLRIDDGIDEVPFLHSPIVIRDGLIVADKVVLSRNIHPAPNVVRIFPPPIGSSTFEIFFKRVVAQWAS